MKTEGIAGELVAAVMAKTNADMEHQAADRLSPLPTHHVLEIGFGPGVGIELLSALLAEGHVAGASAHEPPWPDHSFKVVIAVNCAQVFEPMDANYREIARVMKVGARIVTLTHDRAINRYSESVDRWLTDVRDACQTCGFVGMEDWHGSARSGGTVGFSAVKM